MISDEKYRNNLIMSTQNETDKSSISILNFVPQSYETQSPSIHTSTIKKSFVDNNQDESSSSHHNQTELSSSHDNEIEPLTEKDVSEEPIRIVNQKRRVHFPLDDSQLYTVSYPLEPLSNQALLSLDVILQRYRATCQRLQLRPFDCLLDQLSTTNDGRKSCLDRLDCLKIVREKIDLKHVDAIEEILSRCRFHTLDFESSSIDDAALVQLFDIIEFYESCTHINLSNNRSIGLAGYQALARYLRRTNSLQRVDMNSTRFNDNSVLNLARSLRLSTVYELHLESCQLTGKMLQKFIENLRLCTGLRALYLCNNRMY